MAGRGRAGGGANRVGRALTRRQWLRGAGAALSASPLWNGSSRAAQTREPPLRLVCWPLFNGAEPDYFYPDGDSAGALSSITEPLRRHADLVTFIREVTVAGSKNHFAIRSTYTGADVGSYFAPDPTVPSVDQLVAAQIARTEPTPHRSVHLGVIPADSLNAYQTEKSMVFFGPERVDYEANPVAAFDRLFGPGAAARPTPAGVDLTADALDLLDREMDDLGARLAAIGSEADKLAQHRRALRELRLHPRPVVPPTIPPAGPLATVEKLRPALEGNPRGAYKHDLFADIFDAQIDILARVLVAGLSRVVTLQAGSADNNLVVPVGPGYPHHNSSHGNQFIFSKVQQYYFTRMARLLDALEVPDPLDPGRTVLDNTLVVLLGECLPINHSPVGVPALLVGKLGGRIRAGRQINQTGITNRNVLATVLRAFGMDGAHFGSTLVSEVLS